MKSNSPSAPTRERRKTEKNAPSSSSRSVRRASAREQESEAPGHGHTPVHSSPAASKAKRKIAWRTASATSSKNRIAKSTPTKKTPSSVKKDAKIRTDPRGPEPADPKNVASSPAGLALSASQAQKTVTPQSVQDKIGELAKRCELGSDPARHDGSSSPSRKSSMKVETARHNSARHPRSQSPQTFAGADTDSSKPQSPVVSMSAPARGGGVIAPQAVARPLIPLIADGPLESFMAKYLGNTRRIEVVSEYPGMLEATPTETPLHSSRATSLAPSHGSSNPTSTRPTPLTANMQPLDVSSMMAKKAWERSLPPPPVLQGIQASTLMGKRNSTLTAVTSTQPQQPMIKEASRLAVATQDAGFNDNRWPAFSSKRLSSPQGSSILLQCRSFITAVAGNMQNGTPGTEAARSPPRKNLKTQLSPPAKQGTYRHALTITHANPILLDLDADMTDTPGNSEFTQGEAGRQKDGRSQAQFANHPTLETQPANPCTSNIIQAQYGDQFENNIKPRDIASPPLGPAAGRLKCCKSCFNLKDPTSSYQDLSFSFPQRPLRCSNCQRVVSTKIHGHYEGPELESGQLPPQPGILMERPATFLNRELGLNTEGSEQGGDWWKEGSYYEAKMDEDMVEWATQSGVLEAGEDIARIRLADNTQEPSGVHGDMEFGVFERQFLSGS